MSDGVRNLDVSRLGLLEDYSHMSVRQARALVRSARSYQEAIWIADTDPRQAWLRLVTAVETIAQLQPKAPEEERLREVYPDMAEQILSCGNPELVEWFTRKIADREAAQSRFLKFLKDFGPPRPPRRPKSASEKQDWRQLHKQLRNIYQARSDDLHKGSPIPKEMCQAPYVSSRGIAAEVTFSPSGGKARLRLHIFEYIVRYAILSWCHSVGNR